MLEKVKHLIETSKSFAVLLDNNPEEHEILCKEILEQVLIEKKLPILSLPKTAENFNDKWSAILKPKSISASFPRKTSLKLPKDKYSIEELSCEEDDQHLSLIITTGDNHLVKEDLLLQNLPPQIDAVFCFFENDFKVKKYAETISLPERERIVFITQNQCTLTEKIFDIAKMINPLILNDGNIADMFFSALLSETNSFSERVTRETLNLGSLLLQNGARKEIIDRIIDKTKSQHATQLLGRVLARTYTDELLNVSWSFLNQRDLQKTGLTAASSAFLYELLKKVRGIIPPQKFYLLIWQSVEGIKALVTAPADKNENYLIPLAQEMKTAPASRFFVAGPFENFSQAEIKLRDALKEEAPEFN